MRTTGYAFLVITAFVTLWQIFIMGPDLPNQVASHFDANGVANGWSSKSGFLWMHLLLQSGTAGFMLGIAYLSPWIPDALWNLPHKEYWLHPDRRTESLRTTKSLLVFIAGTTGVFLSVIFHEIYVANLKRLGRLPTTYVWVPLAVYILLVGLAVWKVFHQFRLPSSEQ